MDGFSIGDTIPLSIGAADDWGSVTAQIRRRATGNYLDFADNTFKAAGTAATQTQALTVQGEEWLYLWNSTNANDGGVLSGEQNLCVEYTVDGELFIEDLNVGYGGGTSSGGGMTTADFVSLTTNTVGAMPSQYISSLTTADVSTLTTADIATLETNILDAIQIISDENAYIKYRVRFPNKKGLHG